MRERQVTVATPDGAMPAFVAQGEPARGIVVMLMDGRGLRQAMRDNARRLARAGYYVVLPNLFYRHAGEGPTEDVLDADWMTRLNTAITPPRAAADVQACLDFAAADPEAPAALRAPGVRAGVMGYCMGGRLSVVAAQALGERIAAVGSIHPGYMATRAETSPHRALDRIAGEVYFGIAEHDPHFSPGAVARLREALDANGVDYRMEVLAGAGHGFSTPGSEAYDPAAAERVWARLIELFDRRLGPCPS